MSHHRLALIALPLSLAACAPTTPAPVPPPLAGSCTTQGLERFYGQVGTAENGTEMLRMSGARAFRWLTPNMMVTMEFRADRLNVHLDTASRISSARCG